MNELENVFTSKEELKVSGRRLHMFLEVKERYTQWFERMVDYGFATGTDFIPFSEKTESGGASGYKVIQDHILTIDMAKEIAMLQRTEKGKEARRYFIECEKRLRAIDTPSYLIEDEIERAKKWIEEQKIRRRLEKSKKQLEGEVLTLTNTINELEPKASYLDKILATKDSVTASQIATDYDMSAVALNRKLCELGVQRKVNGQWLLYSKHLGKGYTKTVGFYLEGKNGKSDKLVNNTQWTQKGRMFLYELLKANGILPAMDRA